MVCLLCGGTWFQPSDPDEELETARHVLAVRADRAQAEAVRWSTAVGCCRHGHREVSAPRGNAAIANAGR